MASSESFLRKYILRSTLRYNNYNAFISGQSITILKCISVFPSFNAMLGACACTFEVAHGQMAGQFELVAQVRFPPAQYRGVYRHCQGGVTRTLSTLNQVERDRTILERQVRIHILKYNISLLLYRQLLTSPPKLDRAFIKANRRHKGKKMEDSNGNSIGAN